MTDKLYDALIRLEITQQQILRELTDLKTKTNDLPCKTNTYKIGVLQKIVYGAVVVILLAFMNKLAATA